MNSSPSHHRLNLITDDDFSCLSSSLALIFSEKALKKHSKAVLFSVEFHRFRRLKSST